jgi:hypothetical protein
MFVLLTRVFFNAHMLVRTARCITLHINILPFGELHGVVVCDDCDWMSSLLAFLSDTGLA